MKVFTIGMRPLSPFGTLPVGDTLFGQLCWTLRNRHGPERLAGWLEGYTTGHPFVVVSDAFPADFVRRPDVPVCWLGACAGSAARDMDRKAYKKWAWLPLAAVQHTSDKWWELSRSTEVPPDPCETWQPHNQIDRRTGTTGTGEDAEFAPFTVQQWQYSPDAKLHVHVWYVPERIEPDLLAEAFRNMGQTGYGSDASSGMGRFKACALENKVLPSEPDSANAWLALAPCAPQGQDFDRNRSWYRVFTRFGRHGDVGALSVAPFKAPILLAQSGAVFSPRQAFDRRPFVGQGLGHTSNPVSRFMPETVHQGYAPVLNIQLADPPGRS